MTNIIAIHTITKPFALKYLLLTKGKKSKVIYIDEKIPPFLMKRLKKSLELHQIDFVNAPQLFFECHKKLYSFIEELFSLGVFLDRLYLLVNKLNLDKTHVIIALKKYIVGILYNDVKLYILTQYLFNENTSITYYFEQPFLCSQILPCLNHVNSLGISNKIYSCLKFTVTVLQFFKKILTGVLWSKYRGNEQYNFIFDQCYINKDYGNPEFNAFYRYFKTREDVLYVCKAKGFRDKTIPRENEIYRFLNKAGKPAIVSNRIGLTFKEAVVFLYRYIRYIKSVIMHTEIKSMGLKNVFVRMLEDYIYYFLLFSKYRSKYYLKVRADYDPSHPIAMAVANIFGIKCIGYMHGSYTYLSIYMVHIDFHYYGLLGMAFLNEIYNEVWPKDIKYTLIGPFTSEQNDDEKLKEEKGKKFIVGIFSTSTGKDLWLDDAFYKNFIETCCSVLSGLGIPNLHILFKEKYYEKWQAQIIRDCCNRYNIHSYEVIYHHKVNGKIVYISEDVINLSKIIISMEDTTISWEALGKKKKLLVFKQKWVTHIFERYYPKLVVKDEEQFKSSLKRLINISQDDYEKQIAPIVDNCCKFSDGNLIKDFIEGIER